MEPVPNLLVALHPFAERQDENFTTAAFVHLLRHLRQQYPQAFVDILNYFGGSPCPFSVDDLPQLELATWSATPQAKPYIRVQTTAKLLLIEVKVMASLGHDQVERYLQVLHEHPGTQRRLTVLTRYPVEIDLPEEVGRFRWPDLLDLLETYRDTCIRQPAAFLLDQFQAFAAYQSLMAPVLRTPVSEGLRSYLTAHPQDSIFNWRITNLTVLSQDEALRPFHDLLVLLGEALRAAGVTKTPKFDSGQSDGGWIGYNVEGLSFFYYVRWTSPERVPFQDYRGQIRAAPVQLALGRMRTAQGRLTWCNDLDLAADQAKFFRLGRQAQLTVLKDFYLKSRACAQQLVDATMPER